MKGLLRLRSFRTADPAHMAPLLGTNSISQGELIIFYVSVAALGLYICYNTSHRVTYWLVCLLFF